MSPGKFLFFAATLFLTIVLLPPPAIAGVTLGKAPMAPKYIPPRPGTPSPSDFTVNNGFTVNTDSREQVRDFYNGIYGTSDNVPMNSTADVPNCVPGENSSQFLQAIQRRLNWYRAMAGVPAVITFYPPYNAGSQQVAVMISANHILNHNPPPDYICYNETVHDFAGGNQAEGVNGPDAVTDYIWDFGANNNETGHRRWLLFPPTLVMGSGDVPPSDNLTNAAANSIWVFDQSINNPRPVTRQPYISWPPEGYVPYQVTYPYWSFALSNADVSMGTVTMTSNNVPISVSVQPQVNGFGENTLVWVPMGLDASCECTTFPFNGSDTVYNITVSNINIGTGGVTNYISVSYHVIVFDPALPGPDYVPPVISGPAQPVVNATNIYSATPINNPNVTSYEWLTSQIKPGDLTDNADNGLANFTFSPAPDFPVITNAPDGSGDCFHLCHDNSASQMLELNEVLFPTMNTTVSFKSLVGVATDAESARVQVSTDHGANWTDLFDEPGCNTGGQCESSFTPHTLSLAAYANVPTCLRFDWDFAGGSFYPESDNDVGWCLEQIVITNSSQIINERTNLVASTNIISGNLDDDANNGLANFTFSPATDYSIITNAPDGSGNNCFHLCDDNATSQILQLNETLIPQTNTTVFFDSDLGISTSDESARVQVSTNGGADWSDLYVQVGCNTGGQCESSFTTRSVSLSAFAGQPTWLRFDYQFLGGSYYPNQSANYIGWCLENIIVTNSQQLAITLINTTNFTFIPPQPGNYFLQAVPVIFTQFPLDPGPIKQVTAVSGGTILMNSPVIAGTSVELNFTVSPGLSGTLNLLQSAQLGAPWTTNTAAILTTNTPGASYRFTTTNGPALNFYRVLLSP